MLVAVTGSAGKLGKAAVAALRHGGHRVVGLDIAGPVLPGRALRCDCTDFGAVMGALSGIDIAGGRPDAVVHLAGIPAPGLATDQRTFEVNTVSTYNVLSACARLGIARLVWASSETILGLPFDEAPAFAPLDESHSDRPNWSYSLSKQLGETMAESFCRWHPGLSVASLRFSNVFAPEDYGTLARTQANPEWRKANLWAYIDAEDAGEACRLAVEAELDGHQRMIIAAADTLAEQTSPELAARFFPATPLRDGFAGHASFLSSSRAAELIGFRPKVSWRQRLAASG